MGASDSKGKDQLGDLHMTDVAFLWKIEDYSMIPLYKWMKSPIFQVSTLSYYLELQKDADIKIRVNGNDSSAHQSRLQCKVSVIDREGHYRHTAVKSIAIEKESEGEVILKFKSPFSQEEKLSVFPDDTLTIFLEVTRLSHTEIKKTTRLKCSDLLETLSSDFEKFYHGETDSDFVLKCGDKSFAVHRLVLSARSSVFAAMFRHDTVETRKRTAIIKDIQPAILSHLLYYIYTGKIADLTIGDADSMYRAADKYDLSALKDVCLSVILQNLTAENISDATILADTFGEATLNQAVIRFVEKNLEEVLENDRWKTFLIEKPLLANAILTDAFRASKRK